MDLSPNAMARAAYEDAVAQINNVPCGGSDGGRTHVDEGVLEKSGDRGAENVVSERGNNLVHFSDNNANNHNDGKVMASRIEDIWRSDSGTVDAKTSQTMEIILSEIDSLVGMGLSAFSSLDETTRNLHQTKEVAENRAREAKRLMAMDEQSRSTLSNLLRAVEASKEEARDSSRSAQMEARLRQNVCSLRDERDKAMSENAANRRKVALLDEELRLTKSKLSRVQQEKISIERDSRVAVSLARSLDSTNSNDASYYKRKVNELSDKLQRAQEELRQLRGKKQRNSY